MLINWYWLLDPLFFTLNSLDQRELTLTLTLTMRFASQNLAAVMRSDGFEYLKEECPKLQSEILKMVAGCEDECSIGGGGGGGAKSRSVCGQLSDGGDANGRRVRQRT